MLYVYSGVAFVRIVNAPYPLWKTDTWTWNVFVRARLKRPRYTKLYCILTILICISIDLVQRVFNGAMIPGLYLILNILLIVSLYLHTRYDQVTKRAVFHNTRSILTLSTSSFIFRNKPMHIRVVSPSPTHSKYSACSIRYIMGRG